MDNQALKSFLSNLKEKLISLGQFLSILNKRRVNSLEFDDDWQCTFNAMNAAVWIIDNDHFVVRSNIAAENLFNLSTNEIIGKRCWEIVHGTKEPVAHSPIFSTRKTLKRESMQLQTAGRWFEVIVDPILESKGAYSKASHIVTDITENKLTQ